MAIIGNSGSGKSTLLNMLGGSGPSVAGRLLVDGHDLLKLNERQLIEYKRRTVGFVWQNNARNLIPYLTAVQNVEVPLVISSSHRRRQRAVELLDMVGIAHRKNSRLQQLSAASSSGWPSRSRWPMIPACFWPMNPTGSVDRRRPRRSLICSAAESGVGPDHCDRDHDRQLSRQVGRVVAIRDGRTSSEFLVRESYRDRLRDLDRLGNDEDDTESSHEELAGS
jgi:ABC-type lipoprotein export system ATPase subunit